MMLKKRDRFWSILLVAAIISAVVSFFTTALGLLHYISFLFAGSEEFFDVSDLFGDIFGEDFAAILGDENCVFDPDA